MRRSVLLLSSIALLSVGVQAQTQTNPNLPPPGGDIPAKFVLPTADHDYIKRDVMIPMRDGVKLHTVIVIPKNATNAPIVLTRTPYNASGRANRSDSPSMVNALPLSDEIFSKNGYIRVYQDIRGKYGSEGDYVVTRPVIGPLNPTKVDHTTDAYDTIDWLVNKANLPQSNGRVGMIGSSYEGFTVVMALLHPHPALKVAAPESPMIDGWMGDDWFHYGAFRLANIAWIGGQTGYKSGGPLPPTGGWDDYDNFRTGSAGDWAKKSGYDQLPYWKRMSDHPAYDAFWQGQALDKLLAANPSNVPTIWEQGLWDQEDMYGAITSWEALKAKGKTVHFHEEDLPADVFAPGASIAVDTETMGLITPRDRLCVVQLSDGGPDEHLVRFGPDSDYAAPNLKAVLADPARLKLYHFGRFDIAAVQHYLGVVAAPAYDTKIASRLIRTYTDRHGLKELVRELLGQELSKQQQSSDWGSPELSDAQKDYAASDVRFLHRLKAELDRRLIREGRMELAQQCFDFLPTRAALDLAGWPEIDIFAHA